MINKYYENNAVILSAGLGTRMGEEFILKPKCLANVSNETLLGRHIKILSNYGINNIIVVIGKEGSCWSDEHVSQIKSIHNQLVVNEINTLTNNSYSLLLGLNKIIKGNTIIIDGDLFYSSNFIKQLIKHNEDSCIVTKIAQNKNNNHNKVKICGNYVTSIDRKFKLKFPWLNYTGVFYINNNSLGLFKKILNKGIYLKSELSAPLNEIISFNKICNYTSLDYCININNNIDLTAAETWCRSNE